VSSGPPPRGLIDTDILRAYRRGGPDALAFLAHRAQFGRHDISQVSAMILIADALDAAERTGLVMFFSWCQIHSVTAKIVGRAQRILEALPPPSLLTADDALVAATALEHKLPLYTLDPPRFAGVAGLTALPPY
jgi:predicted nucleic acid-binding protein